MKDSSLSKSSKFDSKSRGEESGAEDQVRDSSVEDGEKQDSRPLKLISIKKKKANLSNENAKSLSPKDRRKTMLKQATIIEDPNLLNNFKLDDHSKTMKLENQEVVPKVIPEEQKKQMRD